MKTKMAGFSLIEFVLVIIIFSIVALMGTVILSQGFSNYFAAKYVIEADWQGRLALERMQRDIRAIRSNTDISTASGTQLTFVTVNGNTVSYYLNGTTLMLQQNSGTAQVLADGVSSLSFTYYDINGAVTATIANIQYIQINLGINLDNTSFTLTTSVFVRNLW